MVTNQTSHHSQQDTTIANIIDQIGDITAIASMGIPRRPDVSSQRTTRSIRLDLSKFQGTDPKGLIFQAEEYFTFHNIIDDSRIQISDFHMTKGALSWMWWLQRNNLLPTWDKFKDDLQERFGGSAFEDKLQELSHIQQTSSVVDTWNSLRNC